MPLHVFRRLSPHTLPRSSLPFPAVTVQSPVRVPVITPFCEIPANHPILQGCSFSPEESCLAFSLRRYLARQVSTVARAATSCGVQDEDHPIEHWQTIWGPALQTALRTRQFGAAATLLCELRAVLWQVIGSTRHARAHKRRSPVIRLVIWCFARRAPNHDSDADTLAARDSLLEWADAWHNIDQLNNGRLSFMPLSSDLVTDLWQDHCRLEARHVRRHLSKNMGSLAPVPLSRSRL